MTADLRFPEQPRVTAPVGSATVPGMPRRPKSTNARVRELRAGGASPEAICEKLGLSPSVVERALEHGDYRGRPRARGVPVRIRLPEDIVEAADARVTSEKDRNTVLVEAMRAGLTKKK
jgi:hypothetical protein